MGVVASFTANLLLMVSLSRINCSSKHFCALSINLPNVPNNSMFMCLLITIHLRPLLHSLRPSVTLMALSCLNPLIILSLPETLMLILLGRAAMVITFYISCTITILSVLIVVLTSLTPIEEMIFLFPGRTTSLHTLTFHTRSTFCVLKMLITSLTICHCSFRLWFHTLYLSQLLHHLAPFTATVLSILVTAPLSTGTVLLIVTFQLIARTSGISYL